MSTFEEDSSSADGALGQCLEDALELLAEADRQAFFRERPNLRSVTLAEELAGKSARLLSIDPRKAENATSTLRWLAEDLDSDRCRALAARAEAALAENHGNYQLGLDKYEEAIELFQEQGDELEEAITRTTAVLCVSLLGHHQRASSWTQKAREVFERRGDRLRLARLSLNYANILFRGDHWEEAAASYRDAHEVLKELGSSEDVAVCLHNMAVCHTSMLDFGEAFDLYSEARSFSEEHHLGVLVAAIDYNIAYLFFLRGEYPEALDRYRAARETCLKLGDKYRYALCAMDEAEIYLELNLTNESEDLATEAYSGFQELAIPYESGKALVLWAISLQRKGKSFAALDLLRQAREVFSGEGRFITKWDGLRRPQDLSMDSEGIIHVTEGGVDGLAPRVILMDKRGQILAQWDALNGHGSWVDAHGDIYVALGVLERVDKYVRQR